MAATYLTDDNYCIRVDRNPFPTPEAYKKLVIEIWKEKVWEEMEKRIASKFAAKETE